MEPDRDVFVQRGGGDGEPVLLLLHGMGATGEVWHGLSELLADRWLGSWVIPDLPGHGRSPALAHYSLGAMAARLAGVVEPDRPVAVLGHSLGGAIGLVLASGWFGMRVSAVCGLGIKVRWSPAELAKAAELAGRPNRVFASRADAADRALKAGGLVGMLAPDSPRLDPALIEVEGGWQLAWDPAAFGVGAPMMAGLLAASRAETLLLAAGEQDPMSPAEHLRALVSDPVLLAGLGHNAHVENPAALLPLVGRLAASVS